MAVNFKLNGQQCPTKNEYEMYLSGKGSVEFISSFEKHLSNCELCRDAITGYKYAFIASPKVKLLKAHNLNYSGKKGVLLRRLLPYAASVAMLFGLVFSTPVKQLVFKNKYYASEAYVIKNNYNKTLMHKSTAEYWYISESNKVSLNDQLISKEDIEQSVLSKTNHQAVFVQVESTNTKTTEVVISKIKKNNTAPVYTYSKHKGLKKNH